MIHLTNSLIFLMMMIIDIGKALGLGSHKRGYELHKTYGNDYERVASTTR